MQGSFLRFSIKFFNKSQTKIKKSTDRNEILREIAAQCVRIREGTGRTFCVRSGRMVLKLNWRKSGKDSRTHNNLSAKILTRSNLD
jgi:hypothetical protein